MHVYDTMLRNYALAVPLILIWSILCAYIISYRISRSRRYQNDVQKRIKEEVDRRVIDDVGVRKKLGIHLN